MRKVLILGAGLAAMAALSACGHTKEQQAASGGVGGAVAGAVVGGPVGAVVGATVGGAGGAVKADQEGKPK